MNLIQMRMKYKIFIRFELILTKIIITFFLNGNYQIKISSDYNNKY